MTKDYLTDEEFDKLNWHEQSEYRWCAECERFYHVESNHSCNTELIVVKRSNTALARLVKGTSYDKS